jgi:CDP-6-deoxy-D-xylo-4-hexulose-3-dehydrase
LPRLDENNSVRTRNLTAFLQNLSPAKFRTDFALEGSSNYAFTLVLREADFSLRDSVESTLRAHKIEFRRGLSGGGNQLRQPYLRALFGEAFQDYPNVDHVHHFGWYIGNYPTLEVSRVLDLCRILNAL